MCRTPWKHIDHLKGLILNKAILIPNLCRQAFVMQRKQVSVIKVCISAHFHCKLENVYCFQWHVEIFLLLYGHGYLIFLKHRDPSCFLACFSFLNNCTVVFLNPTTFTLKPWNHSGRYRLFFKELSCAAPTESTNYLPLNAWISKYSDVDANLPKYFDIYPNLIVEQDWSSQGARQKQSIPSTWTCRWTAFMMRSCLYILNTTVVESRNVI